MQNQGSSFVDVEPDVVAPNLDSGAIRTYVAAHNDIERS
jgi:hypothetical protein